MTQHFWSAVNLISFLTGLLKGLQSPQANIPFSGPESQMLRRLRQKITPMWKVSKELWKKSFNAVSVLLHLSLSWALLHRWWSGNIVVWNNFQDPWKIPQSFYGNAHRTKQADSLYLPSENLSGWPRGHPHLEKLKLYKIIII